MFEDNDVVRASDDLHLHFLLLNFDSFTFLVLSVVGIPISKFFAFFGRNGNMTGIRYVRNQWLKNKRIQQMQRCIGSLV